MADAGNAKLHLAVGLPPEILRARARCRRETAERLWDERLERLLLEEAEELERCAATLDVEAAVKIDASAASNKIVQPDLAALREEANAG